MKKNTKILTFFGSFALLSSLCVGCGSQSVGSSAPDSQITATLSEQFEETVAESTEENQPTETAPEETQKDNGNSLIIPGYEYDDYLTMSAEDDTPVLGYNIPVGWASENKGVWATISRPGETESFDQSFNVMFNAMSSIMLSEIENTENGEFVTTEHDSVETPIGTFRIFTLDYIEDNHMDAQYAIMPVTEEKGVTVSFSYSNTYSHFYHGFLDSLIIELFGEKQAPIEIPDGYDYYVQSRTGEKLMGINAPEGFVGYNDASSGLEQTYDWTGHTTNLRLITPKWEYTLDVVVSDYYAPIYNGSTDNIPLYYDAETQEPMWITFYTPKGTYDTIYGTATLYDTSFRESSTDEPEWSGEVAMLRINGYYVFIEYDCYWAERNQSNYITELLSQMF